MASLIAGSVTLSSAGTTSAIMLDPTARTTTVLLNTAGLLTSTTAVDVSVQVTYDTWQSSGVTQTWTGLSTSHYSSAWDTSSVGSACGTVLTVTGPIAGLRLSSSTFATTTGCSVTMKALQAITAGP